MRTYYHLDHNYIKEPLTYGDISLYQVGRAFLTEDGATDEHLQLDLYELTIVTDGKGIIGTGGEEVPVSAGDIFLSLPADIHSISSDRERPLKYDFISFSISVEPYKSKLDSLHLGFMNPHERVFNDDKIKNTVSLIIRELADRDSEYHSDIVKSLIMQVIIYTLRSFEKKRASSPYLNTDSRDITWNSSTDLRQTAAAVSTRCHGTAPSYRYSRSAIQHIRNHTLMHSSQVWLSRCWQHSQWIFRSSC